MAVTHRITVACLSNMNKLDGVEKTAEVQCEKAQRGQRLEGGATKVHRSGRSGNWSINVLRDVEKQSHL